MIIWTAAEAQAATNCKLSGNDSWEALSISIDSRIIKKGDLFIALKGTKTDGHDYIREAFLKGAAAVMVEKLPAGLSTFSPVMQVENCIEALYRMAIYRRIQSRARFIAVTGSVGKTSTKEMLNIAFSNFGLTHFSFGNNNNEIGAPLSVARMPKDSEFGIFELGMNHKNEISPLSKLIRPSISVITNVSEVHIENFNSVQEIAGAKAEIFDGMDKEGIAVLNADNEHYEFLVKKAKARKIQIVSFGESEYAFARLLEHRDKPKESFIHANIGGQEIAYNIAARGKHMALNSLSVLAAIHAAGLDVEAAAASLSSFSAQVGRGKISQMSYNGKSITLIDDSYNASPVAMRVSIENLGAIETKGRRIAVIGDMLELGPKAEQLHLALENTIIRNQVDLVITVGPHSAKLFDVLPKKIQCAAVENAGEVLPLLESYLKNDDVVLLKSSHGTGLYKVAEKLAQIEQETKEHAL